MKTRSQKLISLALVLVMLATMIPMGIFSAYAEVSAELIAAQADANATELVINSAEDWNYLATHAPTGSSNFAEKTVKLNADIKDATLKRLSNNFNGIFDGQGHTLSNITVDGTALIADRLNASSVGNFTIDGITVKGLSDTSNGKNLGVIAAYGGPWGQMTIHDLTIKNANLTLVSDSGAAGMLIGYFPNNNNADGTTTLVKNVSIIGGTVTAENANGAPIKNANLGGVFGYVINRRGLVFENVYSSANVTNTYDHAGAAPDPARALSVGGFIGCVFQEGSATSSISFTNCVSAGTLTHGGVTAGFIGYHQNGGSNPQTLSFTNCISGATYSVQKGGWAYIGAFTVDRGGAHTYTWTGTAVTKAPNQSNDGATANCYFFSISGAFTGNGASVAANGAGQTGAIKDIGVTVIENAVTFDANNRITAVDMYGGVTEDLYKALANPASVTEFVIKSVKDWEAVHNTAYNTFINKTIKLGADIDAKGATLPTLTTFDRITFDGCDYTIKNAKVNTALFSTYFAQKSAIRNVKFDNIEVTGTNRVGLLISHASLQTAGQGPSVIENIIATNITINATGATATGGLIGNIALGAEYLTIKNVSISGSVTADNGNVGGLVGNLANNVEGFKLEGAYIDVDVTNNAPTGDNYANVTGGAIGNVSFSGAAATLPIKDVYFCGNLATAQTVAGIIGYCTAGGRTITMDNVAVNGKYELPGWTRAGFVNFRGEGYFNYTNLYINTGGWAGGPLKWYCLDISSGIKVNGATTAIAQTHLYNAYRDVINTLMDEPKIDLSKVVKVNGYKVTVVDHVYATAIQESTNNDGDTYAVRFIATAQLINIESAKMNIVATYMDNGVEVKRSFTADCTLYDKLTVYGEYGIEKTAEAADFNACKLAALTIYGIPTGAEITFEVTTTYVTVSGQTVAGAHPMTVTFDANGALVK